MSFMTAFFTYKNNRFQHINTIFINYNILLANCEKVTIMEMLPIETHCNFDE